jgi:small subunit ribosomal protein S1
VEGGLKDVRKGNIVTCTVTRVVDNGIEVLVNESVPGFIRKNDLSRERSEQRPDRFAVGEKVDAKVTSLDKSGRKVNLSIKAREAEEEKKAMEEFGSSDSGASLGDILGAAIKSKQAASEEVKPAAEAKAKPAKKAAAEKKPAAEKKAVPEKKAAPGKKPAAEKKTAAGKKPKAEKKTKKAADKD